MSQRNVDDDLDWEYAEQQFERLREALAQLRRYEAVIEAARAHKKREDTEQAGPYDTWTTDWDIYYAIEALDKAEEE